MRLPLLPVAALALLLAPATLAALAPPAEAAPRVVVAVVDTGVNPYHAAFHGGEPLPADVVAELGARTVALTRTGDLARDLAADAALWSSLGDGDVVHFAGTRLVGVSVTRDGATAVLDEHGHGTAVVAAVLAANPRAVVLVVEGTSAAAVRHAARHPAVDIVSTSFGPLLSLPVPGIEAATREAVLAHGKLHVGAADNTPAPAVADSTAGPWWSVGVAGFEEGSSGGKAVASGTFPDFAADYTQSLPRHDSEHARAVVRGTSFATPRAAGLASLVLLEAREAAGHLGGVTADGRMLDASGHAVTQWDLRRALNHSARAPALQEYRPAEGAFDLAGAPVAPESRAALVGWGVLDASVVEPATRRLLDGPEPFAGGATAAAMARLFDARRAYWG